MWSLRKHFNFSERNKIYLNLNSKFKFEVEWYVIAHCSRSGWKTCDSSSKDCMLGNRWGGLKPGLSLSDFKTDVDLISFSLWQRVEKKIVKVNQTIPFGQVIPKWIETISNLKRHIHRKREQVANYNKKKDELKTGETLIYVAYNKKLR